MLQRPHLDPDVVLEFLTQFLLDFCHLNLLVEHDAAVELRESVDVS